MGRVGPANGDGHLEPSAIVGVGASAGGLKALEMFIGGIRPDAGLALVVVQHLDPNHESEMAQLLQNHTAMPVSQVEDATRVEAGHVYIIPPNASLVFESGRLHLKERPRDRTGFSLVDMLFRSLADALGERAVGVVLSGSGSDGSVGLKAVKEAGGFTLAQAPGDAEYDGMPRSAIATGLVDVVAPAGQLSERLMSILEHRLDAPRPQDSGTEGDDAIRRILRLLRERTGRDFDQYKRNTVVRRLYRRMMVLRLDTPEKYLEQVTRSPDELDILEKDLLISVTNFFRDPPAFAALTEKVMPHLFAANEWNEVRVWVPGCATGEEVYSLAMLLCEARDALRAEADIQLFGTDIDEAALAQARRAEYPTAIRTDMSDERLDRFFRREGESYRVVESLRELILFAPHDLLNDPPFSRLDMISCRNLLIYLTRNAQRRVLELFHYALKPDGVLFLGNSELADGASELYVPIDSEHRIYRRRSVQRAHVPFPTFRGGRAAARDREPTGGSRATSFAELHQQLALRDFVPPSVLVDGSYDIVHVLGSAGRFLEFGEGEGHHNLLRLARPGLRNALRSALYRAVKRNEATWRARTLVQLDGRQEALELSVVPLVDPEAAQGLYQVVFGRATEQTTPPSPAPDGDETVERLEEELARTRTELQTTVQELETANEELNASNEELQSTNEELQSTNEELETSQEELQSTNEELVAVNQELRSNVDQLHEVNTDLANLLAATDIATLFLDRQLRIKRYTPAATDVFNLIPGDVGRPFAHLSHRLDDDAIEADARRVLERLERHEREIPAEDGRRFLLRMLPYRTVDDHIGGIVVTAIDITARTEAEREMEASQARLQLAMSGAQLGWWRRDMESGGMTFDPRSQELFGVPERAPAEQMLQRVHPDDRERVLAAIVRATDPVDPDDLYAVEHRFAGPDGEERWMLVQGRCRFDEEGGVRRPAELSGIVMDITERKQAEQELRASENRYRTLFENASVGVGRFAIDGRFLEVNDRYCEITGRSRDELLALSFQDITHPDDVEVDVRLSQALVTGEIDDYRMDKRYLRPDGGVVWVQLAVALLRDPDGDPEAFVAVVEDITLRKEAESELQVFAAELEERVRERTRQVQNLSRELTLAEHRERHRIARILHDDLQQELYSLQIVMRLLRNPEADERRLQALSDGEEGLRRALAISRTLTSELSPPVLDDEGLAEAVGWLANHMRGRYGLTVDVTTEGEAVALPTDLRVLLFQIVRELLFNVVKHADVDRAFVRLSFVGDDVGVLIEDRGSGFTTSEFEHSETGMGLATIRRRLELVGGRFELTTDRSGTRVSISVPRVPSGHDVSAV